MATPALVCEHPLEEMSSYYAGWQTLDEVDPTTVCVLSQSCNSGAVKVIRGLCEGSIARFFGADGHLIGLRDFTDMIGPTICNPETWGEAPTCDGRVLATVGCVVGVTSGPDVPESLLLEPRRIEDLRSAEECQAWGTCEVDGVVFDLILKADPLCNAPTLHIFAPDGERVSRLGRYGRAGEPLFACLDEPLEPTAGCGFVGG